TAAIQVISLISATGMKSRSLPMHGVSLLTFARIVGGQIFLAPILGQNGYAVVYRQAWWIPGHAAPLLVTVAGLLVMGYVAWKSNLALRLFMLFCALTFDAALAYPMSTDSTPPWPPMVIPGVGARYAFLPMLAWVISLAWLVWPNRNNRLLRLFGGGMLAVMIVVGIPLDWKYPPYMDLQFST